MTVHSNFSTLFGARRLRSLLAIVVIAFVSTRACASEVWVITDRLHPVTVGSDARLIELDAPSRIEAQLSAHLPNDPIRAAAVVQQRLKAGGRTLQLQLAKSYQDVTDAWSLGVRKVPAVVVDRRYVVYGESNVAKALVQIEKYRSIQR